MKATGYLTFKMQEYLPLNTFSFYTITLTYEG